MDIIKNILGKPKFKGKGDWDFDGIKDSKDCQPFNPLRQDDSDFIKNANIVKRKNYRGTLYYAVYDDEVEATGWTEEEAIQLFKKMKKKRIKVHPSVGQYF